MENQFILDCLFLYSNITIEKLMIMKKLILIALAAIFIVSCDKTEEYTPNYLSTVNEPNAGDLDDIIIPIIFNWSSSYKGSLGVSLDPNTELNTDGAPIHIINQNGEILDRGIVVNNSAEFYYTIPQNDERIFLNYPNTGESVEITNQENIVFSVGKEDRDEERDSTFIGSGKKGKMQIGKTAANVLVNGDFSLNDIGFDGSSEYDLRSPGKWYAQDSDGSWKDKSGNGVYESLKNNKWGTIMQSVAASPNAPYTASFTYTGNSNKVTGYVDFFDSNDNWISYRNFSESSGTATSSGTTPNNCAYVQIYIRQKKKGYVDDVVLDVAVPNADSDGDGVVDNQDEFPNDPTKAYTSKFPTSGYQTLAFEDLWPAKGDFDFNDMVISNQVVYGLDANGDKVDATFTISLDAAGSGFSNGLAMVFTDGNKQALNQNIVTSVSGDASLDPNVPNGVIIFNDVFLAQTTFYQNNGVGISATPDVFTFTVVFNSAANNQVIIPDTYIFRTSNRGQEVHLDGFLGSAAADANFNNTVDDVNGTYNTDTGLPWAIEIVTANKTFKHPTEKNDILLAYPGFQLWAENGGTVNTGWLTTPILGLVF